MNLEKYDTILHQIAEESFFSTLKGESGLYQIGKIPNIEFLDYDDIMIKLNGITQVLEREYMAEFPMDLEGFGFDDE